MAAPWPTYKTHEELAEKLEEYFEHCEKEDEVPNIAGMTYFCGFSSRSSWRDYENKSDEFAHVIKKAKNRSYNIKCQMAMKGKIDRTIFIFDAVNNHDMFNTRTENKNDSTLKANIDTKWEVEFKNAEDTTSK